MTKEEVLKKFEELGYECVCDNEMSLILEANIPIHNYKVYCKRIHIDKHFKSYIVVRITRNSMEGYRKTPEYLSLEEHQLLTELFKCEGWIK